jgi:hypothetical protein
LQYHVAVFVSPFEILPPKSFRLNSQVSGNFSPIISSTLCTFSLSKNNQFDN